MHIARLILQNFRNLAQVDIRVPPHTTLIALIGANGAGKTSVLEALSLLSPGNGLLGADRDEQIRKNASGWELFYETLTPEPHTIGMAFSNTTRTLKINNEPTPRQTALTKLGSVVWLTPELDQLFKAAPSERRNWLDRLVFGLIPTHAETVTRYRLHLKNRQRLLKDNAADDWLGIEELQAATHGLELIKNRQAYLAALSEHSLQTVLHITGSGEKVFESENPLAAFTAQLAENRERDKISGHTSFGPQRADIIGHIMLDAQKIPLHRSSSGQHKKALAQLLMSHVALIKTHTQQTPLVLIDEATAHLDPHNRALLLTHLATLGAQVWLTDTETPTTNAHVIHLADGLVSG